MINGIRQKGTHVSLLLVGLDPLMRSTNSISAGHLATICLLANALSGRIP